MSEGKSKQLRPIRTQRVHSDYETSVRPKAELWLQYTLKSDDGTRNILKSFGIDKNSLKTAGIPDIDRVYNTLFIYSQGVYSTFQELVSQSLDSKSILKKLWLVYTRLVLRQAEHLGMKLSSQLQQSPLQVANQEIQRNQQQRDLPILNGQVLETEVMLKSKESELNQSRRKQLQLSSKLENMQKDQQYLMEMMEERDRLVSQEIKKRVRFETKINQVSQAYQQSSKENQALQEKIRVLEQEKSSLEDTIQAKQAVIEGQRHQIGELKQRIKELTLMSQEQAVLILSNQSHIKEINSKLEHFSKSRVIENCNMHKKEAELLQQKTQLQIIVNQLSQTKNENAVYSMSLNYQEAQLKAAYQEIAQKAEAVTELQSQLKLQSQDYKILQLQLSQMQGESQSILQLNSELKAKVSEISEDLYNARSAQDLQAFHVNQLQATVGDLEVQVENSVKSQREMEQVIRNLQKQLELTSQHHKHALNDKKGFELQVQELFSRQFLMKQEQEEKLQQLNAYIAQLKQKNEELSEKCNEAQAQKQELQRELVETKKMEAKLGEQMEKLIQEKDSIASQIRLTSLSNSVQLIRNEKQFNQEFIQNSGGVMRKWFNRQLSDRKDSAEEEEVEVLKTIISNLNDDISRLQQGRREVVEVGTQTRKLEKQDQACQMRPYNRRDKEVQAVALQIHRGEQTQAVFSMGTRSLEPSSIKNQTQKSLDQESEVYQPQYLLYITEGQLQTLERPNTKSVGVQTEHQCSENTTHMCTTEEVGAQQLKYQNSSESRLPPRIDSLSPQSQQYKKLSYFSEMVQNGQEQPQGQAQTQAQMQTQQSPMQQTPKNFAKLHKNAAIYYKNKAS